MMKEDTPQAWWDKWRDFLHRLLALLESRKAPRSRGPETRSLAPQKPALPAPSWVLVLAIDISKEAVLQQLEQGTTRNLGQDDLYRASRFCWMLRVDQDQGSLLKELFKRPTGRGPETEYDARLAMFELRREDPRFREEAGDLERMDALRELTAEGRKPRLSGRLSPADYAQTKVYQ